jgi:hypothetical protein
MMNLKFGWNSLMIACATAMFVTLSLSTVDSVVAADETMPATQTMTPRPANGELIDSCTTELAPGHARAWQVMAAVHMYILTHRDKGGAFGIADETGEARLLDFIEIRQPVRHSKANGQYVVCTDFRKQGSEGEHYDIDFWLNQQTGKLKVKDVKIHKAPLQENGIWTQVPRYTFGDMEFDITN